MEKVGSKKKMMMMQRVASYPGLKQENISVLNNNRNKPACSNPKKFSGLHHRELASSKAEGMLSSSSSSRQSTSRMHNSCNDDDDLSDMMIFKETASPIFSQQLTPKSSKLPLRKSKPKSRTNNRFYYRCAIKGCPGRKLVTSPKERHRSSFMEVIYISKHTCHIRPRKRRRVHTEEVPEEVLDRLLAAGLSERVGAELKGDEGLVLRSHHTLPDAQLSGSKFADSATAESESEGLVLDEHCGDDEKMGLACEKDHDSSTLSEGLGGESQEWDYSQVETSTQTYLGCVEDSQEEWAFLPEFRIDKGDDCTMQRLDHFPALTEEDPENLSSHTELSHVHDEHQQVFENVNGNLHMKESEMASKKDLLANSKDISSKGRDAVSGQKRDDDDDSLVNISESIEQLLHHAQSPTEVLVAGREAPLGASALEFLFLDATSMSRVVGVGMDYAKVLLTSSSEAEVILCGEEAWKELWTEALNEQSSFKIMAVKLAQQQQAIDTVSRDVVMSENEMAMKFGVGLKGSGVVSYVSNTHQKPGDENGAQMEPLLLDIAQHMMMKKKMQTSTTTMCGRQHTASGADGGNHDRQGIQEWETGQAGNTFNLPTFFTLKLDSRGGNGGGDEDSFHGILPKESATLHEKPLALRVRVQPGRGGTIITSAFHPKLPESLSKVSAMFPTFTFDFKKDGASRAIDVKILAECALGDGGPKPREKDRFGWYHDHIAISFKCLELDEAVLHHYEMDMGDMVGGLLTKSTSDNSGTSWQSQLSGQATIPIIGGLNVTGSEIATRTSAGTSMDGFAIDISNRQVSKGFNYQDASSTGEAHLSYCFFFHREVPPDVWKSIPIRRWFNQSGICATFRRTISGSWEPRSNAENTPYLFKMERELCEKFKNPNCLAGVVGVSENSERKYMQEYMVPLYVNHAMTHLDKVGPRDQVLNEKVKEIPKVMLLGQRVL
ncbi:unnamed protein product [Sphagnum compactum]